jgi:CHAT domain-containing protein
VAYAATASGLYALVIDQTGEQLLRLDQAGLDARVNALNTSIAERRTGDYLKHAHAVYQQVFAPLATHLPCEELLIVPDGPLHLLNFESLLTAPGSATEFQQHLLIQRHAIAYLLSATTAVQFAQLARERANGTLALAPGFTDDVKQRYLAAVKDSAQVDHNFLDHVRQPFALRTAEELGGTMRAQLLLGADATEHGFRKDAERFGILHLGTHAEMNATDPMYSRLVLSKDGAGVDPDADGYLHAYEIYELDLRAQLAVLTACRTGSGRHDEEGVRSLGYSFAYAGCPSLVMSLWDIDEQVSSAIITRFYALLADGMPKHKALRQAKLEHLEQAGEELLLPYYWAGLVLVGDVEPVELKGERLGWWVLVFAALVVAGIWWARKRRS